MVKLYFDQFSDDPLLSDAYPIVKEHDGTIYTATGKYITIPDEPVGEEEEDQPNPDGTTVIDLVHDMELMETAFDKKDFMGMIKRYMGRLVEHLQETNPSKIPHFQKTATEFMTNAIRSFDDYMFFLGRSGDSDSMVILAIPQDEFVKFYYFADGLKE